MKIANPSAEVARKIDRLDLWKKLAVHNWAIRPLGSVYPYFCFFMGPDRPEVKFRLLLLEGWQTMHDLLRLRLDRSWSYFSSPMELNHFELVYLTTGEIGAFRHNTGYLPRPVTEKEDVLLKKLLWQVYGMMLRIEADENLPMSFAAESAIFSRKEVKKGKWIDESLELLPMRPHVERVEYRKETMSKVKDLPVRKDIALEVDLRIVLGKATADPRPRLIYEYIAVEAATRKVYARRQTAYDPELGLRGIWEGLPGVTLETFLEKGLVPGEIKVKSKRVYRLLSPLTMALPFKLSLLSDLAL